MMRTSEVLKRTIIVVAVALAPLLVWLLFDIVLIALGAILLAALLQLLAEPFTRWCRFPRTVALVSAGMIILGAFGGAGYLFGVRIESELQDVLSRADAGIRTLSLFLQGSELGKLVLSHIQGGSFSLTSIVSSAFSVSFKFLGAALITLITGFYFAAESETYRSGVTRLFPRSLRTEVDEITLDVAAALRFWLIGQLIQMVVIGALSTLAVWVIGLPSPLALGAIAGVAEFVPFLGPVIASIPAILVATTNGLHSALWTAAAYLIIHQLESEFISPMIQRRMVHVPPALMLLGIVIISNFGAAAFVFAAPMVVIIFVTVGKLYVRETLGEPVSLPGEDST